LGDQEGRPARICAVIAKGSHPEQVEEGVEGKSADPSSPGKWLLKQRWWTS